MRPSRWFTMHGPAFTAVLLASLAITSLYLSTSNQIALTRISHTSQVQRAISKLSGSLTDVIVAERNFHLTGNKAYLADRLSTHKRAIDQFRVTSTLIDDNAKQTLLFAELRPPIDQRFATEQILIDTRLAGALAEASIAPLALILVVEDENSVRALTSMTLRELGYTVVHAEDAVSALQQLDVHPEIELLFTDIVMPGMNGRKLADEAVLRRPKLKVLFTTGFTRNAVVHGGVLDAGVNFIAKPFTIEQIAAKVAKVIDIAAVPA